MRLREFALRVVIVSRGLGGPRGHPRPGRGPMNRQAEGRGTRPASPPWTTSQVRGTPEPPPPYRVEPAFPRLRFEKPIALTAARGLDRVFVAEVGGKVYSFPNRPDVEAPDLAIDLSSAVPGAAQLYGIAFHPDFARNRLAYLCYITRRGGPEGSRVSSFVVEGDNPPRFVPGTEKVLLTFPAGGHNAGCLAFGPEGYLYISTGDAADPTPPDPLDTGQDLGDLLSSILRIDVDQPEAGRAYRVPPDNPFVGLDGARPEIWAFGFRNPWRFSFDRANGDLWAGDVGWELWEMIHLVRRGGNYGWSIVEGPQPVRPEGRRGPGPIVPPAAAHPHSEAASITGGYVYRGKRLAGLAGVYVYGDFQSGKIWGLRHDGREGRLARRAGQQPAPARLLRRGQRGRDLPPRLRAIAAGLQARPRSRRRRLESFPRTLSQTGLFASVRDQTPASGRGPLLDQRRVVVRPRHGRAMDGDPRSGPGRRRIESGLEGPRGVGARPDGLARTRAREPEEPATARDADPPLRGGVLAALYLHLGRGPGRRDPGRCRGGEPDPPDQGRPGPGRRAGPDLPVPRPERVRPLPQPLGRAQDDRLRPADASPLAFHAAQLNREIEVEGAPRNQIQAWQASGLLDGPSPASPEEPPRLANPYDREASLEARARSYLEVNCAHCHQ